MFSDLKTPVLFNVNFGHAFPRTVIPYGVKSTIDYNDKRITIDEAIFEQ